MSNPVSLSASLAVRRIIDGDTLSVYFTLSGADLFQGVDPNTGEASPHWTDDSCPKITPHVSSARKQSVKMLTHSWSYNGTTIQFATGSGWVKDTNMNQTFKMNTADGTLAIVKDLASKDNQDSDVVTYTGTVTVGSSSYTVSKTQDILLSPLGANSYVGYLRADTTMLDEDTTTATITPALYNGSLEEVTSFNYKVYRGSKTVPVSSDTYSSGNSFKVHRNQTDASDLLYVDSHQLFIVDFLIDGSSVYTCGISIDDAADLYQLDLYTEGTGVDASHNVVVKCKIRNINTDATCNLQSADKVTFTILKNDGSMDEIRKSDITWGNISNGFTVQDSDTKDSTTGETFDVTVNATATGTIID